MLRLGTAVYTYLWECSLEQAIERCAGFGFKTMEIMTTPPSIWPAHFSHYQRRRLLRQNKALGVRISSLNPTFLDLNLVSLNPAIYQASLNEIKENIRLAADIEAGLVVVGCGRRHALIPSPFADAEALLLESLYQCVRLGSELGVTVGIENLPGIFIATGEQQAQICEQINSPYCKCVFDVANAYMVEDPAAGLRAVAKHLALVHYSDTKQSAWGHTPVGMGEVNFQAATDVLREIGYDGVIILETTYPDDPDGGIRSSLEKLSELGIEV